MPAHATTYENLAKELGVTPRAIRQWKERHDDWPKAKADGRHNVEAWRKWMLKHNLKHSADDAATVDDAKPESMMTGKDWKARKERAAALKAEHDYEKALGRVVDRAELEQYLGTMMVAFSKQLDALDERIAHVIGDGMSFKERKTKARAEIQKTKRVLEACEYLPKEGAE